MRVNNWDSCQKTGELIHLWMFLQIETVNCALLQRKDQEANNGVVHIINGLLDPSYTVERDLAELLVQVSGCPKIQEVFRFWVGGGCQ